MMPFKKIPKQFLMETTHTVVAKINSIAQIGSIKYDRMSIREVITGQRLIIPKFTIGMFVHAVPGNTSSCVEILRNFDALYLSPRSDGHGHRVMKIATLQPCNVHWVIDAPIHDAVIKSINHAGSQEKQPEGLQFTDASGNQTMDDFKISANIKDDDASNKSYHSHNRSVNDDDLEMDDVPIDEIEFNTIHSNNSYLDDVVSKSSGANSVHNKGSENNKNPNDKESGNKSPDPKPTKNDVTNEEHMDRDESPTDNNDGITNNEDASYDSNNNDGGNDNVPTPPKCLKSIGVMPHIGNFDTLYYLL